MKKISFNELSNIFFRHNKDNNITTQYGDENALTGVIVFDNKSFDQDYPLESRSYRFRSDNKAFLSNKISNSIWAESIDKTDYIRVDWYIGDWIVEYCYIEDRAYEINN